MKKFKFIDGESFEEEEFDTLEEAVKWANDNIRGYLDSDGWSLNPDDAHLITIVEVKAVATWVPDKEKKDFGNFEMKEIKEST